MPKKADIIRSISLPQIGLQRSASGNIQCVGQAGSSLQQRFYPLFRRETAYVCVSFFAYAVGRIRYALRLLCSNEVGNNLQLMHRKSMPRVYPCSNLLLPRRQGGLPGGCSSYICATRPSFCPQSRPHRASLGRGNCMKGRLACSHAASKAP